MLANMWGRLLNGACPTQWTPSPPICDQEVVSRSIHTTIPWQPMPAVAREPSGTRVLVLCGQPGQNHGLRSAARESANRAGLERPYDVDLVQPQADPAARGFIQAQIRKRLARIAVGLAARDDAEPVVRPFDDVVVEPVGAHVCLCRGPFRFHQ